MTSSVSLRLWLKRLVKIFLVLLLILVVGSASCYLFLEVKHHQTLLLPDPTGSYAVGRMEYDWIDQSRNDPLAPQQGKKRELVVWAWYPAEHVSGAHSASYLPSKWGQLIDQQHSFIMQSSASIQTHSIDHAPLASGAAHYPVLVFEPGLGNIPTQYTTLLEDLASHGYIIFAITPTYSSDVVVFPNGRVATATPAGNPEMDSVPLLNVWSQDEIFVLNQLARLNTAPGTMWSQHLDLTRLGIFGHSFGGATAAQVCHLDARCKAGIDMDGYLAGDVVQTGLTRPFMVFESGDSCSDAGCHAFQSNIHAILRTIPHGASYYLGIKGTEHFNFSDYAIDSAPLGLRALGALGSIDGQRGLQITRAYVRAFFDTYLDKTLSPLLQGPSSAYPEVQFFHP